MSEVQVTQPTNSANNVVANYDGPVEDPDSLERLKNIKSLRPRPPVKPAPTPMPNPSAGGNKNENIMLMMNLLISLLKNTPCNSSLIESFEKELGKLLLGKEPNKKQLEIIHKVLMNPKFRNLFNQNPEAALKKLHWHLKEHPSPIRLAGY